MPSIVPDPADARRPSGERRLNARHRDGQVIVGHRPGTPGEVRDATLGAFAAVTGEPLERQALATVNALVRVLVRDPRRARVLLGGVAATPSLRRHREQVLSGLTLVLIGQARAIHGVELERDPLAQITPAFVVGGTAEAVLAYLDGTARITLEQLVSELTTLWLINGNGAADVARARLGR